MDRNDENYIYYVIGQNIKKKRKLKNLTQEQLAEKCNYSLSFIGNLESTKVFQTISVGSLYHIAKVLDKAMGGIRVEEHEEVTGLDTNLHEESAYNLH